MLDDVWVPDTSVLGTVHRGFYETMKNFQNERMVLVGMGVGAAQAAIDLTSEYTQNRAAFGGELADLGAIRQRLAMDQAKVDAVRASMYHAAWLGDQGVDNVTAMSGVKAWGCEVVNQVMYDCLQFHGGMGYMRESTIERMARDARILPIGGGATEVMLEEVAKRLLATGRPMSTIRRLRRVRSVLFAPAVRPDVLAKLAEPRCRRRRDRLRGRDTPVAKAEARRHAFRFGSEAAAAGCPGARAGQSGRQRVVRRRHP